MSKGNYVAVVCEREEQAIRAARQLKVNWQKPATAPFPASDDLFTYMRSATPTSSQPPIVVGNPDAALAGAAKVVEAEYDVPFQGHTAIGPAHAMADPSNGQMTIYSNDMKSYGMRNGVAEFLGMPREQVRVVWMEGPAGLRPHGGRRCGVRGGVPGEGDRPAGARAVDAERRDRRGTRKGPAFTFKMRGGLDAQGQPRRARLRRAAADYNHLGYNEADTVLIAQLMGTRRATPAAGSAGTPSDMYAIPNRRTAAQVVSLPLVWETPLRTGNLRDPNGPQIDLRRRIVHRRAGGRGEGRSGRVPPAAAHGRHGRRQRLQARAFDRGAQGGGRGVRLGRRVRRRSRSAPATS